jgi:hypothetical protein
MKFLLGLASLGISYGLVQCSDQNDKPATHTEQSITGLPTSTKKTEPPPVVEPKQPSMDDELTLRWLRDGTIPPDSVFTFEYDLNPNDLVFYFSSDLGLGPTNVDIATGDSTIHAGTQLELVRKPDAKWYSGKKYQLVIADGNDQPATRKTVNSDEALPAATATSAADYAAHLHELAADPDYDDTARTFGPAVLQAIEAGGDTFPITEEILSGVVEDVGVDYIGSSRLGKFETDEIELRPSTGGTVEAGDSITVEVKQN